MLKNDVITSIREFLQTDYPVTEINRWAFTYYVIEYDGSAERKQDISRFMGGFCYGDLTLANTALMNQHWPHRWTHKENNMTRKLDECIETIDVGDWVCLSCGKFFLIPKSEIDATIRGWSLIEIHYDHDRFKKYYDHIESINNARVYYTK